MGFFDELSDSIVSTTQDLGKMAQNAGNMTKIQYDMKVKQLEVNKLYEKLGRKYYEEHKDEDSEDLQEIKELELKLQELNDELMQKKGGKACPKCGALVKTGAMYCSSCGEKVNDMFEEE